jgi:L-threonylcarbamoyladenylate synthase
METRVLTPSDAAIAEAAALIRRGELVAFPTETVYGLGADALNTDAVGKIFAAKGRPADNPLIVHVADPEAVQPLCHVDERAKALMQAFWPGPLTLLLPKKDVVPPQTNAGLASVAVRMPDHPVALALLRASGVPIAAPSANVSGRPSPTTAKHVLYDMDGRIPVILDGGACAVGLESTVLDMTADPPVIVRPGGVTREMLLTILPQVEIAANVLRPLSVGETAVSPGMMYRHYAPKGALTLVRGKPDNVRATCLRLYREATKRNEKACVLTPAEHAAWYEDCATMTVGSLHVPETFARELFAALRAMDDRQVQVILCEAVDTAGIGLAIMNRLYRAASFRVLEV